MLFMLSTELFAFAEIKQTWFLLTFNFICKDVTQMNNHKNKLSPTMVWPTQVAFILCSLICKLWLLVSVVTTSNISGTICSAIAFVLLLKFAYCSESKNYVIVTFQVYVTPSLQKALQCCKRRFLRFQFTLKRQHLLIIREHTMPNTLLILKGHQLAWKVHHHWHIHD
jgi:hypothetical protein